MSRESASADLTVADLGEFGLIDRLARILNRSGRDPLRPESAGDIGIGDDAALWEPTPGFREVLTTDALIEDVHFRHRTTSWHDLGWKALAVNVSDIAAMGARPTRAFVTLGLRPETRVADLEALYEGMAEHAKAYGFAIAGGDTVSSPFTMLSITVVGELQGEGLRRSAGKAGDLLAVTGWLGSSAGGLAALEQGLPPPGRAGLDPDGGGLAYTHLVPLPRVREGLALAESGVRCGMDLSDGLLGDAGKLAYASGLGAVIDLEKLPMSKPLRRRFGDEAARMMALAGGEDYELLIAASPDVMKRALALVAERDTVPDSEIDRWLRPLTVVGRLEAGTPGKVTVLDEHGRPVEPPKGSWDHFRAGRPAS